MTRPRSALPRLLLFTAIALLATSINVPLARFPWQDLLWNDLMLLSRVAWTKAVLLQSPFASIDFLQGLGSNVRQDVKVVAHFYDPAVFFSLLGDPVASLYWRHVFLCLYCALGLDRLIREEAKRAPRLERLRWPLIVAYLFTPQLYFEVSHHFSAIFYAVPVAIVALRSFVARGRPPGRASDGPRARPCSSVFRI